MRIRTTNKSASPISTHNRDQSLRFEDTQSFAHSYFTNSKLLHKELDRGQTFSVAELAHEDLFADMACNNISNPTDTEAARGRRL